MGNVYTLATWTAKPGREDDFVALWQRLAEGTIELYPRAAGTLLRDRAEPRRFVSFGGWDSAEQVAQWRESPPFRETVAEMRDTLESFEPGTFDVVVRVGG